MCTKTIYCVVVFLYKTQHKHARIADKPALSLAVHIILSLVIKSKIQNLKSKIIRGHKETLNSGCVDH